ncbi:MAG: Xaa-Pro peptidase family protein [Candidatus Gracilibacteria bacterium]|nr:Xaa-Pro peptidase family protein [Candidatus Gracilibacteria bacterium]
MNLDKLSDNLDPDKNYLFTSESDVRYLLGNAYFKTVEILVKEKKICILADTLNKDVISSMVGDKYAVYDSRDDKTVKKLFGDIDEIIVDPTKVTMEKESSLKLLGIKNVGTQKSILSEIRSIKTNSEVEMLKHSQSINMKTLKAVEDFVKIGMSEEEIADYIRLKHFEFGARGESFEPMVAFGENGANIHHISSSDRKLRSTDQILIDIGCIYRGYCSDMTRVIFMDEVQQKQKDLYELVKNTTYECLKYGKIGMTFGEFNEKAKELLGEHRDLFIHTLSHGIGVDVHEIPLGKKDFDMVIREGNVFSIEPGIYFPEEFGFRYEIMALARQDGLVEL